MPRSSRWSQLVRELQEPAQPVRARELVSERAGSVARAMQAPSPAPGPARQTPDPLCDYLARLGAVAERRPVTLLFAETIGGV